MVPCTETRLVARTNAVNKTIVDADALEANKINSMSLNRACNGQLECTWKATGCTKLPPTDWEGWTLYTKEKKDGETQKVMSDI